MAYVDFKQFLIKNITTFLVTTHISQYLKCTSLILKIYKKVLHMFSL